MSALVLLLVLTLTGCATWTCGSNRDRPGITCTQRIPLASERV